MGKVGQQSPDFLRPVSERKGNLSSFFAKQTAAKKQKKDDEQLQPRSPEIKAETAKETKIEDSETIQAQELEEAAEDTPLNPDDGDKVKANAEESSKSSRDARSNDSRGERQVSEEIQVLAEPEHPAQASKSKVSEHRASPEGRKEQPIVLDDSDDEGHPPQPVKRSRSPEGTEPRSSPKKKAKQQQDMDGFSQDKVDEQGNERLTNFFEVVGD